MLFIVLYVHLFLYKIIYFIYRYYIQSTANKAKELHAREIAELEDQIQELSLYSKSLEKEIVLHSDYDEIKKELAVLKMIEFAGQSVSFYLYSQKYLRENQ